MQPDWQNHSENWSARPLTDLCSTMSGGTPPKSDPALWNGGVPWISGKDLKSYRLSDAIDHITEQAAELYSKVAPENSVLVLVRGMGLAKGFPVGLIERPMAFN
jgi:type I restriction enzyme S subunit